MTDTSGQVEAEVITPSGTKIVVKGSKDDVAEVLQLFAGQAGLRSAAPGQAGRAKGFAPPEGTLDGVAELDEDGNFHVVATHLKASSAMDAATRLIYVSLLARRELLQEKKTERALVNEILKSYNLYDGNTRRIMPSDKSLVTEGRKYVALSGAALPKAWEYIREIQDPTVSGVWAPSSKRRKQRNRSKTEKG